MITPSNLPPRPRASSQVANIWRPLAHKSLRFLITVGIPLIASYYYGFGSWLLYLILGAILGFVGDVGGTPLLRLGFMSVGPLSLAVGAIIGTLCHWVQIDGLFLVIAVVVGVFYALVENRHGHMVMMPRFIGYGLVFGYSVSPINVVDVILLLLALIWSWLMSMAWDIVTQDRRPFSVPSLRRSIIRSYLQAPMRWRFATATGISVALALLTCTFTGNTHQYWTMLTMLIVVHTNVKNSAFQITHRVTGTLIGVFFVILLVYLNASPGQLLIAAMLITILRWPAFALHNGLGTACITAFVLLLAEMMTPPGVDGMPILKDRLLAIFIGCAFSLFTIDLERFLHRVVFVVQRLARFKKSG